MYVIPTFNVGDDDSNEKITDDEMAHKQVDDDISATVVEGDLTILIKLTFYVNYFECRIVSTDCVILVFKYDTITIRLRPNPEFSNRTEPDPNLTARFG